MLLLLFTVVLGAVLIWSVLSPPARLVRMGDKLPGPRAYPIVGNIFNFLITGPKAPEFWKRATEKYGNTFRMWLGPQLHIFVSDPDDMQVILSSTTMITKPEAYDVLSAWLGTGLLVSTGQLWQRRRKAITPTFHFKILEQFVPIFNKCAMTLVNCLKDKVGKDSFLVTDYMSNCALDAVAETAMGTEINAQINPLSEYPDSVFRMTKLLVERINNPLLGMEPFYTISGRRMKESSLLKILLSLPMEIIRNKQCINVNGSNGDVHTDEGDGIKKKTAFLELLLKMKQENVESFQTDQDIRDEVITFMFEGHDTTTMALTFTIWLLGKHQEVQEKLYQEVSSILVGQEPSIEDFYKMSYLERVLKESLRLYPAVPIIGRKATEDIVLPSGGYVIPAGASLDIYLYILHRNEKMFPDPEKFNPDRFLEPIKHPYAFIPFSAGPRNCIGQKFAMLDMKVIISHLVMNYKIESDGEVFPSSGMLLRSAKGPNITITLRN